MNLFGMKLFDSGPDGGSKSTVEGLYLIEIKGLFSVVLLKFNKGSREAYHTHAFNALTFWLKGHVTEHHRDGEPIDWRPSFRPKFTGRGTYHKVYAHEDTYALTFRGPWQERWKEYRPDDGREVTLTHGRREIG